MSLIAGFLQSLREDPDDDTCRLIFADWLEEQNDASLRLRGELLRLQCRLAAGVPEVAERTTLQQRERDLLDRYQPAWLGRLREHCQEASLVRGLAQVTIPARRFVSQRFAGLGRELLRAAWVERLRLERPGPHLSAVAAAPSLEEIGQLDLSRCELDDAMLRVLLRSPHLERLVGLDLGNNRLTDRAAEEIVAARNQLQSLRVLNLRNNRLSGEGALRLVRSPLGRRLQRLDLLGNEVEDAGLLRLEQTAGPRPRRLVNSLGMRFTLLPAGVFLMGSPDSESGRDDDEGPVRPVTISRPFYLGTFPVTQQEYERVTGDNPSQFRRALGYGPAHPVENISWYEATEFCRQLSAVPTEKAHGHVYRLPTEAEWEHAVRAGLSGLPFYCGPSLSSHQANFNGLYPYQGGARGSYLEHTTPVGSYQASPWGLFDMHGNVWEWCSDFYSAMAYKDGPDTDPKGPASGERRVLRGGSWLNQGVNCRAAARDRFAADFRYNDNGLRVVLEVPGLVS